MVIWSEYRMVKYRDADHRKDAPHFIFLSRINQIGSIPFHTYLDFRLPRRRKCHSVSCFAIFRRLLFRKKKSKEILNQNKLLN